MLTPNYESKHFSFLNTKGDKIKPEIDKAVLDVMTSSAFIGGPEVKAFQSDLEKYLGVKHVIPCANGTDALQIAMMALGLQPGDEIIVPVHTYVATAEVIALLRLEPVFVDVHPDYFTIDIDQIEKQIGPKTKAIVPVHLYGQCADMESIMKIAKKNNLYVVEDTAQAIGADYTFSNGNVQKAGTIGVIGTTSFFPSKNLGCYGDGGALFINDDDLAKKCKMIANHGQSVKYHHDILGSKSRVDTLNDAILNVKLQNLDAYSKTRQTEAKVYDKVLKAVPGITNPKKSDYSTQDKHKNT